MELLLSRGGGYYNVGLCDHQIETTGERQWSTDNPAPSHSIPGQVALKAARRQGSFEQYHLALMKAYFYDNLDVTDPATAISVAGSGGLDTVRFEQDLDDLGLAEEVAAEHIEAARAGISSVPTVVVDGMLAIPGAQELRFYRNVVDKRLAAED